MILTLILLICLLGGGLDNHLPDNTFAVLSINPKALAETPAFAKIREKFIKKSGLDKLLKDLDTIAGIRFFEEVDEVTLIVPFDVETRKNVRIIIRGAFQAGGLLSLAEAKGMDIDDNARAGACILTLPGQEDKAIGILEDGAVMIANKKDIVKACRGMDGSREGRLDPSMNAALSAADFDSMIWGAFLLPSRYSAVLGGGTKIPVGRIERVTFHVDAAYDFFFKFYLTLKDGMEPKEFIDRVNSELGLEESKDRRGKKPKKALDLPEAFKMAPSGKREVFISFSLTPAVINEAISSMK